MNDLNIRLFAFDWLRSQVEIHGDVFPRILLQNGFNAKNISGGMLSLAQNYLFDEKNED